MSFPEIYRSLGLKPIINCATTYTRIGGSIMEPEVAQAMAVAAYQDAACPAGSSPAGDLD